MDRIVLDKNSPLYVQVGNYIRQQITSGELKPGDRLISEAKLQLEMNVSRVTIRKAIDVLIKEGYLFRVKGKGTFIKTYDSENQKTLSLTKVCLEQGKTVSSKVVSKRICSPTKQTILLFGKNDYIEVVRIRMIDGIVIMLERTLLPNSYTFCLTNELTGSLYQLLRDNGVDPDHKGKNELTIKYLDTREAKRFNVQTGMPVIHHKGLVYSARGDLVLATEELVRVDLPEIFRFYL